MVFLIPTTVAVAVAVAVPVAIGIGVGVGLGVNKVFSDSKSKTPPPNAMGDRRERIRKSCAAPAVRSARAHANLAERLNRNSRQ